MEWDKPATEVHLANAFPHRCIVGGIYQHVGIVEQGKLLHALVLHAVEVFLVRLAKAGEHAYGGLYDALQGRHFVWLRDGSLEDAYLATLPQPPHREWDSYLRIVATRAARYGIVRREHLVEPLLHRRLAVAACYAYDWYRERLPMPLCQTLQCLAHTWHEQEIGILVTCQRPLLHDEVAYAPLVQVRYVLVTVATTGTDGEEERRLWETKAAAVRQQPVDIRLGTTAATCPYQGCYIRYGIHF